MRIFAIGDIHGGLRGLAQLIDGLKLQPEDRLIFMGDYVDGWSESAGVVAYLIDLSHRQECVFIKGNHDVWCEDWLKTGNVDKIWLEHGGKGAMESYRYLSSAEREKHLVFFEHLKLYHLDEQNRLFVHAGFTSTQGVEHEPFDHSFYYDRTLWLTAFNLSKGQQVPSKFAPERLNLYKEIYVGHTPTFNFNSERPLQACNVWDVDTGAAFYGPLSALEINTKQIFQSEVLRSLYPDEKGRNDRSLNQIFGKRF